MGGGGVVVVLVVLVVLLVVWWCGVRAAAVWCCIEVIWGWWSLVLLVSGVKRVSGAVCFWSFVFSGCGVVWCWGGCLNWC